jgi:hypothetical protein
MHRVQYVQLYGDAERSLYIHTDDFVPVVGCVLCRAT